MPPVWMGTDVHGHKTCTYRDVKKTRSHQVFEVCNEYQDQSQNTMNEVKWQERSCPSDP